MRMQLNLTPPLLLRRACGIEIHCPVSIRDRIHVSVSKFTAHLDRKMVPESKLKNDKSGYAGNSILRVP